MVLLAAAASLNLYKTLTPVAGAESAEEPPSSELAPVAEPPAELQLIDGDPQATSMADLRRDNAMLSWTPTGTDQDQDTYDVRVSTTSDVDEISGELKAAEQKSDGLLVAHYDMTQQPAGTYHWQVRACRGAMFCKQWSPVWTMTLDDVAPVSPTASVVSGKYDMKVRMMGAGEAGTKVAITVDDTNVDVTVADDGTWSYAYEKPFDYGRYEASVTSVDAAGNVSEPTTLPFSVNELFVASQIVAEELPVTLDIVPVDETPENKVFKLDTPSVIDVMNSAKKFDDTPVSATTVSPLSTDGGIVRPSESGWQVFGLPWFMWAGFGGVLSTTWLLSTGRLSRSSIGI